ncbi:MAG: PilZ domain-containing protein [Deltaproteobacteria bacterium]|nr:PilZ domain-containing protein [Deltaproteobacteria bacterium]
MATQTKQEIEKNNMAEKREHPREACSEATFCSTKKGIYEGLIKDIGVKGVFIATDAAFTVGEIITVAVPSTGDREGGKLRGEIVWKRPGGFGVYFKSSLNE